MAKKGRKTVKQLIDERLAGMLTVTEVIDILQKIERPDETYVGTVGHFGEFHGYDKYDFQDVREAYVTSEGGWRDNNRRDVRVLNVGQIDIGPDPD